MTKADIINEIAETTGIDKKDVSTVVECFMKSVKDSLLNKRENVYLRGFVSFNVKHRAAKTQRANEKREIRTTLLASASTIVSCINHYKIQ